MRVNWLSVVVFSLLMLTVVFTGRATAGTDGEVQQTSETSLVEQTSEIAADPAPTGAVDVGAGVCGQDGVAGRIDWGEKCVGGEVSAPLQRGVTWAKQL